MRSNHTPHPIRAIACGKPVFVLRIPWADDVSGNRSKQYNAHMNMYLANLNLPHKLLSQEYFVRFCAISTISQHASSLEQFDTLADDWRDDSWSLTYDCKLQQEILFWIGIHLLPADNPQQAETTPTAGSSTTFWCREDDSGGSASHRKTDEGYHALYSTGKPKETVTKVKKQIRAACLGVSAAVEQLQTDSGVKDKISVHWIGLLIEKAREIQKHIIILLCLFKPANLISTVLGDRPELQPGDHYNILLRLRSLDPHRDSPCEILHTVLLGEDKYVWHETIQVMLSRLGKSS
ncbi:hypothetical protein DFH08DRAFT_691283 [Mycena albidolilacea]|uniref:Uncharacterized protein n=1 Tax=Mycena albidolilacea TaxID=1033008 RepID=A0AAD7ABL4_9AGAR|nr:hypothetical protein DFH08DRAFT_691283 [Mycena albidolilacea]